MTTRTTNIIVDCDPGVDDAMALLLLFGQMRVRQQKKDAEQFKIIGITICHGNLSKKEGVHQLAKNACRVLNLIEQCSNTEEMKQQTRIPVVMGASTLLCGDEHGGAAFIHGDDGMGGSTSWIDFDENDDHNKIYAFSRILPDVSAADWIVNTVNQMEDIVIVTLGPLTNIALALRKDPKIVSRIRAVYTMGGALNTWGNISEVSEANVHNDPLAANEFFESGLTIYLAPLNLTRQLSFNGESFIHDLVTINPIIGSFILHITKFYLDFTFMSLGTELTSIHDSTAVALLAMPDVFSDWKRIWIRVETQSELTRGMTVCDFRGGKQYPRDYHCNVHVPMHVEASKFKKRYYQAIAALSPIQKPPVVPSSFAPLRKRFILCLGGSFNPVHQNHIDTMIAAKKRLEDEFGAGCVLAGYFAVSTDGYVSHKLGNEAMAHHHRMEMCRLALKDCYWMIPTTKPFASAQEQLERTFGIRNDIEQVLVIGGDRAKVSRAKEKKNFHTVIVGREGFTESIHKELGFKDRVDNVLFVKNEVGNLSSSAIRKTLTLVHQVKDQQEKRKLLDTLVQQKCFPDSVAQYIIDNEETLYLKKKDSSQK